MKQRYVRLNKCGTVIPINEATSIRRRDYTPLLDEFVLEVPKGAEFFRGDMFYKKGVHDKVFVWINEWQLSSNEWSYVKLGKWVATTRFLEIKE